MDKEARDTINHNISVLKTYVRNLSEPECYLFISTLLHKLLSNDVDERSSYHLMLLFNQRGLSFSKVKRIDSLLKYLHRNEFRITCRLIITNIRYRACHRELTQLMRLTIGKKDAELEESWLPFHNAFEKYFPLAQAFDDRRWVNFIKSCPPPDNVNKNSWEKLHRNEIVSRIQSMISRFGLRRLRRYRVPIIDSIEFGHLTLNQQATYYQVCCKRVVGHFHRAQCEITRFKILRDKLTELETFDQLEYESDMDNDSECDSDSSIPDIESGEDLNNDSMDPKDEFDMPILPENERDNGMEKVIAKYIAQSHRVNVIRNVASNLVDSAIASVFDKLDDTDDE